MKKNSDFTKGPIMGPLLSFMFPVLFAMLLQAMYGAVDLMIVGKFADSTDVSAVSTGSQITMTLTNLVASFSMGTTIFLGQMIGAGQREKGGEVIGTSICLFAAIGLVLTILVPVLSVPLASVMNAPEAAFDKTVSYIRICGVGFLFIIAYNLIGSVFRGIGDSKTPLVTVAIACVVNIAGDLLLVAVFNLGTAGAAIATVLAQAVSVGISFLLIRKKELPFSFNRKHLRFQGRTIGKITKLGLPIAVQDLLVGISFLVILAIVNNLGLIASAGVGVAERVCGFIMLIPSSFSQSVAAFSSQNFGDGNYNRARKTLFLAIAVSLGISVLVFAFSFFRGDLLAGIFSRDPEVIQAGWDYLKAYAIDCMLTSFMFCFTGFFNGLGMTRFVMMQGIAGAFFVRVPLSYLMSRIEPISLFRIGLATPASTLLQIILCMICFIYAERKYGKSNSK